VEPGNPGKQQLKGKKKSAGTLGMPAEMILCPLSEVSVPGAVQSIKDTVLSKYRIVIRVKFFDKRGAAHGRIGRT